MKSLLSGWVAHAGTQTWSWQLACRTEFHSRRFKTGSAGGRGNRAAAAGTAPRLYKLQTVGKETEEL
jgi:hypothetical protein